MAEKCASCGRADLMQPDIVNYQCLACGALTSISGHQVVNRDVQNVTTAPSGAPVVELSKDVTEVKPAEYVTPVHVEEVEEAPEAAPEPAPEEVEETPAEPEVESETDIEVLTDTSLPIDLSSLSDGQIQALREALD